MIVAVPTTLILARDSSAFGRFARFWVLVVRCFVTARPSQSRFARLYGALEKVAVLVAVL